MNEDLGLSTATYGLGAGLFFATYATMQIPANMALSRVGGRRWLASICVAWGLVAACFAAINSTAAFLTLRTLLGVAEARPPRPLRTLRPALRPEPQPCQMGCARPRSRPGVACRMPALPHATPTDCAAAFAGRRDAWHVVLCQLLLPARPPHRPHDHRHGRPLSGAGGCPMAVVVLVVVLVVAAAAAAVYTCGG